MSACITIFLCSSVQLPRICVPCPSLWNQLCVCLLYLANLLQESRLPAAAPSLHIQSVEHHNGQEDSTCTSESAGSGCTARSRSVEAAACMWSHLFHLFQAPSDQLCVLTLPAFISWSTCSRRASCQQQSLHTTSAPSDPQQAEHLRQAVAAFLSVPGLPTALHQIKRSIFYISAGLQKHHLDCGLVGTAWYLHIMC